MDFLPRYSLYIRQRVKSPPGRQPSIDWDKSPSIGSVMSAGHAVGPPNDPVPNSARL